MILGFPVGVTMILHARFFIIRVFLQALPELTNDREAVETERWALGAGAFEEKAILVVFGATAVPWGVPGRSRTCLPHPDSSV